MGSVAPCLIVFTLDTPRGGTSTSTSTCTHSPSVSCQLWEPSTRPVSPAPGPHIQRTGVKPGSAADWSPILIFSLCPRSPGLIAAWSRDWWDVLNCSASTTIFTVNGSHRNTSYSDAGLKGIFSTHATINKHVDVATSCCCRLLKCNYNFCAQPPLGEVQCSAQPCSALVSSYNSLRVETSNYGTNLQLFGENLWPHFCFVIIWTLSLKLRP